MNNDKLTPHQKEVMDAISNVPDIDTDTLLFIGRTYVTKQEQKRYEDYGYVFVYALRTSVHPLVRKGYLTHFMYGHKLTDKGLSYIKSQIEPSIMVDNQENKR